MSELITTVGDIRKAIEGRQDSDMAITQIVPKDGNVFLASSTMRSASYMNTTNLIITMKHELLESLVLEDMSKQEPAAHMFPSDLERFKQTETFGQSFSVEAGRPGEDTVPLYRHPKST